MKAGTKSKDSGERSFSLPTAQKLGQYVLTAGSAALTIGVGQAAQAEIKYFPTNITIEPGEYIGIDLDGGSANAGYFDPDYGFYPAPQDGADFLIGFFAEDYNDYYYSLQFGLFDISGNYTNAYAGGFVVDDYSPDYVAKLSFGDLIYDGSYFSVGGLFQYHKYTSGNVVYGNYSPWNGNTDGYAGLTLDFDDGSEHYGWAHISFNEDEQAMTLHGFAYETTAWKPLHAGEVPEPSTLVMFAMGAAGLTLLRRRQLAA